LVTSVSSTEPKRIGVLALQGDFREHREMLQHLGVEVVEVRLPRDLADIDGLIIPGGESTAMSKLLQSSGLDVAITAMLADGLPVMGTCAGMILLATGVVDSASDQKSFGAVNIDVRRNGIGAQSASHETSIQIAGFEEPFVGIFIRPPVVEGHGPGVEVLAELGGKPVLCRQGSHLVASFHPEIAGDARVHQLFLERL